MKNLFITETDTIKETLKKLDKTAEKVLMIIDDKGKLIGTITDGDIRRYLLQGNSLEDNIQGVYCRNPLYIKKSELQIETIREILLKRKIELLPIIDQNFNVIDYITWDQAFSEEEQFILKKEKINVPVIVMAGGEGTRLEPFTKILPKPLIPVGEKTIIERIMHEFQEYGVNEFHITLNYKGEMIKAYLNGINHNLKLDYIFEEKFLGTAGSLKLLEKSISETFIVSNCDIIVKANYADVINFHKNNESYLTILSSIQHYQIPYGVIKFKKDGEVIELVEKPEHSYTINTGVYIMNRDCLRFIPESKFFHMTDLINELLKNKRRVLTYPVNENDYMDIGQWEEYKKSIEKLK